jgi:hypothetical protein
MLKIRQDTGVDEAIRGAIDLCWRLVVRRRLIEDVGKEDCRDWIGEFKPEEFLKSSLAVRTGRGTSA